MIWTVKCVRSNSILVWQKKVCTKLLSLLDIAKKTSFAFFLLKFLEFALSPRLHPQPDHIINICHGTTSSPVYRAKLTMIFYLKYLPHWIWTHRHNQPILSGVSESSTYPLQNWAYFFWLNSRLGSLHTNSLHDIVLDWSQVTHMLASKKTSRAYEAEQ